jgi:hypothetical protein
MVGFSYQLISGFQAMDIHDFLIGNDKFAIRVLYIDKVRHIIDQGIEQMFFIKQLP